MDTTTRKCKICENEFDSIFEIDNGICDECKKDWKVDHSITEKQSCKVCGWWTIWLNSERICEDCYKDI